MKYRQSIVTFSKTLLVVIAVFSFILIKKNDEVSADADDYCSGGTCAGVRVLDVKWNCNKMDGYCTQAYQSTTVTCDGYCQYETYGRSCDFNYPDCTATPGAMHAGGCCVGGGDDPCVPSTGCSCGSLATSPQGFGSKVESCGDGCGGNTSSTCYCTSNCTPNACPSSYYTTDQGNGSIIYDDCENVCGIEQERICYCPAAECVDLDNQTNWLDSCPAGETCRTYDGPVPIPNNPSGCPATQDKRCYNADNEKPQVQLVEIVPRGDITNPQANLKDNWLGRLIRKIRAAEFSEDTILNYHSTTHSGRGLDFQSGGGVNNPVGLRAVYSDTDGRDDILALYIWWNPSSTKSFPTPRQITSGQARTNSEQNWGFMISRDSIGGNWEDVYAPRTSGTDRQWIREGSISEDIEIFGPTPEYMVRISNISISDSGANRIELELTLEFLTDTNDTVKTAQYNIWSMANDYIGFTRFMTDGNIKDYDEWRDSNEDWSLDMEISEFDGFSSPVDSEVSEVTIDIDVSDDDEVAHVRLDACKTGIDSPTPLSSNLLPGSYDLLTCDSFSAENIDMTSQDSLLGSDGNSVNSDSYQAQAVINLGTNSEGAITYYLTVLDKAGNVIQDFNLYKLEQWAIVKDGLVFGREGVTSSTRELEDGKWDTHSFLNQYDETTVDLTNQVLLGARSQSLIFLRELVRTGVNSSFSAANYPGLFLGHPYQELKVAYEDKIQGSTFQKVSVSETISGNLSDICSASRCVLESTSSLSINNLVCDTKALIAVQDDVYITPDITNGDEEDVCIILAQGDINVRPGGTDPTQKPFYDTIEAFLIAGQQIDLIAEGDGSDDGLYLEGGLVSFTPSVSGDRSSVNNQREIHYSSMGLYPVIVVDNNSKYGLFGREVFGSQIYVFKSEVGFKPY
jgi:hypothetical protein